MKTLLNKSLSVFVALFFGGAFLAMLFVPLLSAGADGLKYPDSVHELQGQWDHTGTEVELAIEIYQKENAEAIVAEENMNAKIQSKCLIEVALTAEKLAYTPAEYADERARLTKKLATKNCDYFQ